jgi:hypothetical protein
MPLKGLKSRSAQPLDVKIELTEVDEDVVSSLVPAKVTEAFAAIVGASLMLVTTSDAVPLFAENAVVPPLLEVLM